MLTLSLPITQFTKEKYRLQGRYEATIGVQRPQPQQQASFLPWPLGKHKAHSLYIPGMPIADMANDDKQIQR